MSSDANGRRVQHGLRNLRWAAIAVAMLSANGCGAPTTTADGAPVAVWNDSDGDTRVAVIGETGQATFTIPPHALRAIPGPNGIGAIGQMVVLDDDCIPSGGNEFGDGANAFTAGGQMWIHDGAYAGWSTRLPPQWAQPIEPGSNCN